jgi:ABC-2 type transport system ATP-binding protein
MNLAEPLGPAAVIIGQALGKCFPGIAGPAIEALAGVSFTAMPGKLTALVGPDGAGKTTLIRLIAGLMAPDRGTLTVLGIDSARDPQAIQNRIGYMPQRFGLYDDLSVQENLDLYADLHGVSRSDRQARYPELMAMTALGPFTRRLAGDLSGGMKQKLGLACALVRKPELVLLDEPTVGVDPLSRRELWAIISHLAREDNVPVLISTSYLDEAGRCDHVLVLHHGKLLSEGPPSQVAELGTGRIFAAQPPPGETIRDLETRLLADPDILNATPEAGQVRIIRRDGATPILAPPIATIPPGTGPALAPVPPRFEDGFMILLRPPGGKTAPAPDMKLQHPPAAAGTQPVIEVDKLVKRFGAFVAVDGISFQVQRGEIFGLLGPNGAGKTTTFRMLCGLLRATSGDLRMVGTDLKHAPASARQKIGYVAQKFSLYAQLSVTENLDFFASAYGLHGSKRHQRIEWAMAQFDLGPVAQQLGGQLPGGYKQRLATAAALLHEPDILFLDEATSGADPLARQEFWQRIAALAKQGVTVIVTTHFMVEAEYCDRIAILDSGRVLAQGSPGEIRKKGVTAANPQPTMEDAFIAIIEAARSQSAHGDTA